MAYPGQMRPSQQMWRQAPPPQLGAQAPVRSPARAQLPSGGGYQPMPMPMQGPARPPYQPGPTGMPPGVDPYGRGGSVQSLGVNGKALTNETPVRGYGGPPPPGFAPINAQQQGQFANPGAGNRPGIPPPPQVSPGSGSGFATGGGGLSSLTPPSGASGLINSIRQQQAPQPAATGQTLPRQTPMARNAQLAGGQRFSLPASAAQRRSMMFRRGGGGGFGSPDDYKKWRYSQ